MRAQTDRKRLILKQMGPYLEYREKDVGQALLSALMRFSMKLNLSHTEMETVRDIELNCSKHISVVNDIYSWEKELKAAKNSSEEGSALCSSVLVMATEANLSFRASKRILWMMCREWELVHEELWARKSQTPKCSDDLLAFIKGLEYQMSGNEAWSRSTLRYHAIQA
ncbi:aristolochene synthase [Phlyctema vagabunda]|uniref:Aristolochene synthase n=1 Tax=Phlyctema vagabunda TaxID=108571 RepID=A0ABR4P1U3_9HELO